MNFQKLLLVAMVFYLPNQAQFAFEFPVRGLNTINVLFLLIWWATARRHLQVQTPAPMKGAFYFFFFVLTWALVVGMASDSSQYVDDITAYKNCIFYMLLYFLFYYGIEDIKTVRLLVAVILFVTLTSAYLGLRQALDYGIGVYNETRRVSAPFGWGVYSANRSAIFFCIFIPLLLSVGLFCRSRPLLRIACFGAAGLSVFVVFHTYSRQSYFILAVIALVLTLRKNIVVAVLISIALINFELWVPQTVIDRVQSTTKTEEASKPSADGEPKFDDSTESRFIVWEGAGNLILERPWGIGLNHFKREIGAHVPPELAGKDAHNFYVLFTTEAGLLAPLALLILLGAMAALGRRVSRLDEHEETRALGVGYGVALVAVVLGSLYGSRFLDGDVMGNFWILTGIVARYEALVLEARAKQAAEASAAGLGAGPSHTVQSAPA